jgi:hypothetical protein
LGRCGFSRTSINARRRTAAPEVSNEVHLHRVERHETIPATVPDAAREYEPDFRDPARKIRAPLSRAEKAIYKGRRKEIHERSSVKAKARGAIAGVRAHPPIWQLRLAAYEVRQVTTCLIKVADKNLKSNSQPIRTWKYFKSEILSIGKKVPEDQ